MCILYRNLIGFYFTINNTHKGGKIRFHIINMTKKGLLYKKGMKIAMFSKKDPRQKWFRGGEDIQYTLNKDSNTSKPLYILSFTHEFLYDDDTISIAFSEPYTITDLKRDLNKVSKTIGRKCLFNREALCTTIGGTTCELITLTSTKYRKESKKAIIITARVHPGETVGSWMTKGILEFLTSNNYIAEILLDRYVFKIIPCLNPDGVIQGNYRCSLSGSDLNRKYIHPSSVLHPSIYYLKAMVKRIGIPVAFYCDLHGHSKKKDVFAYGNTCEGASEEYRLFPFILSKLNPLFSYKSSKFSVNKSKASTARVAMWRELKIPTVYTIEASFYGATESNEHFTSKDLILMGHSICQALLVYRQIRGEESKVNLTIKRVAEEIKREFENNEKALLEGSDSGSDSNPPENEADLNEIVKKITNSETKSIKEEDFDQLLENSQNTIPTTTFNKNEKKEMVKNFIMGSVKPLNEATLKGQTTRGRSIRTEVRQNKRLEIARFRQSNKVMLKIVPICFSTKSSQISRNKPSNLYSFFDGSNIWKASSYNRYFFNLRYKKLKQDIFSKTQDNLNPNEYMIVTFIYN